LRRLKGTETNETTETQEYCIPLILVQLH